MPIAKRPGAELRSFGVSLPGQRSIHPIFIEELSTTPTFAGSFIPKMEADVPSLSTLN